MSHPGRLRQFGSDAKNFVSGRIKSGAVRIGQLKELSEKQLNKTAFMLAPAFLGLPLNSSEPHSFIPSFVTTILGGVAGNYVGRKITMTQAGAIAGLSVFGGLLLNTLAGFPPEMTSPIIDGGIGIALGTLFGAARRNQPNNNTIDK